MSASSLLPAGFIARDDGRFRVLATGLELDEMCSLLEAARDGRPGGEAIAFSGDGRMYLASESARGQVGRLLEMECAGVG